MGLFGLEPAAQRKPKPEKTEPRKVTEPFTWREQRFSCAAPQILSGVATGLFLHKQLPSYEEFEFQILCR